MPIDLKRHVLTLDLKDDPRVVAAYRRYHAAVWPEVVRSLEKAGIAHLEIHLLGRRLVMIVEMEDGLDLRRVFEQHAASDPKVAEWERLMKTFQQRAPGAREDEWWALMEPVYRLSGTAEPQPAQPAPTV
jgi:L-rhamnose mutarotase